jgi:hypothetical protein
VEIRTLAACSEFPNDNTALHLGAVWVCEEVLGPVRPIPVVVEAAVAVDAAVEVEVGIAAEVVVAVGVAAEVAVGVEVAVDAAIPVDAAPEPVTLPTPPVLEADDDTDDIEIVDEIAMDDAVDEMPEPPAASEPPPADDPFATLVRLLEDMARGANANDKAMATLRAILGRERLGDDATPEHAVLRAQATGWQALLRNESEDFEPCGPSPLDEWSATVLARALGESSRVDSLRRELRRRGVAAFGLVAEAA